MGKFSIHDGDDYRHLLSRRAAMTLSRTGGNDDQDALKLESKVLFHEKVTAKSESYGGIHPLVALHSHQASLGPLLQKALAQCNAFTSSDGSKAQWRPDFVSVTRGPGMRSNLTVGLEAAKGLALAWGVPLVGVHHMQAHALTPRLCSTLRSAEDPTRIITRSADGNGGTNALQWTPSTLEPTFPFLSVLASGGHTMLIESSTLLEHRTLAETADIAIGTCLDKAARAILPSELLIPPYGRALENFAFPDGESSYSYTPPAQRKDELELRQTAWGWAIRPPLAETTYGKSNRRMVYSFAGMLTYVQRLFADSAERCVDERRKMGREVMRVAFEHLASRILLHLSDLTLTEREKVNTVVVSGGVAANSFLRHVLRAMLNVRGFEHIKLEFPPIELCTDNALMIAWAGMEMFDAGYHSELNILPIRKWSMDPDVEDGGILGVGGWKKRTE
ncbi:Mitochondrial tRNAs modification protein [Saxophila tyrrhenica]|uniref:N(6)-L-threonylcarbamoyladenine synthase n=1 Tax=Saxophila tyrrhenica TaxID=1690608 RepID=A0AAV9NWF7_9PEZI|nr:Mitochondrial tRNAs modification protein [Saxophila tyrrhenica]